MAIKIMAAASTSTHYHVYLKYQSPQADVTVSTGLANSRTLCIPVYAQNVRFTFNGTFGSGSASTQVMLDLSPDGVSWATLLTVSALAGGVQTTVLPLQADHIVRFRHAWTSAAAAITNASVDAWIG